MDAEPVNLEMEEIPTKTLVIDRTVARNTTLPYDVEFDDNTQILTDKTSNLSSETSFITPTRPRLETTEPFTGRGKLLADASLLGQKMDYTIIGDKLRDALKGTDWAHSNTHYVYSPLDQRPVRTPISSGNRGMISVYISH